MHVRHQSTLLRSHISPNSNPADFAMDGSSMKPWLSVSGSASTSIASPVSLFKQASWPLSQLRPKLFNGAKLFI